MKRHLFPLLALLVCVTAQHAFAQQAHTLIQIPVSALRAAYQAGFGARPDLGDYQQLALAINRCRAQYFPDACGAFWNGVITANNVDPDQSTYSVVTIGTAGFPKNPQNAPTKFLAGVFENNIGRPPDLTQYPDLALAISRYDVQNIHCAGGFWNGEHTILNGTDTRGIVWVRSAHEPQNVPVSQLAASFQSRMGRPPNFNVYGDMALAVTSWIQDYQPGKALGGFWNGEQANPAPNTVYGIVLVR